VQYFACVVISVAFRLDAFSYGVGDCLVGALHYVPSSSSFWLRGGGGGGGVDYSIRRYSSERRPFSSLSEGFFYEHMVALDTFMQCAPRH
jgi:hypothetical protein